MSNAGREAVELCEYHAYGFPNQRHTNIGPTRSLELLLSFSLIILKITNPIMRKNIQSSVCFIDPEYFRAIYIWGIEHQSYVVISSSSSTYGIVPTRFTVLKITLDPPRSMVAPLDLYDRHHHHHP